MTDCAPRVSIIIPTYKRADILPVAVDSAWSVGTGVEVVVIDDQSPDHTPEVARALPNIRYVRLERNVGLAGARNAGIEASRGDYLIFLDDDDRLLPDTLQDRIAALDARPDVAFSYAQVQIIDEGSRPTGVLFPDRCPEGDIFWDMLRGLCPCCHSFIVRRRALDAVGTFDASLRRFEDWDLWLRLSERSPVIAHPYPVGTYRVATPTSGQLTSDMIEQTRVGLTIQSRGMNLPRALSAPPSLRRKARAAFLDRQSDLLILSASEALKRGMRRQARACLQYALRLRPLRACRPWTFRLLAESLI